LTPKLGKSSIDFAWNIDQQFAGAHEEHSTGDEKGKAGLMNSRGDIVRRHGKPGWSHFYGRATFRARGIYDKLRENVMTKSKGKFGTT